MQQMLHQFCFGIIEGKYVRVHVLIRMRVRCEREGGSLCVCMYVCLCVF